MPLGENSPAVGKWTLQVMSFSVVLTLCQLIFGLVCDTIAMDCSIVLEALSSKKVVVVVCTSPPAPRLALAPPPPGSGVGGVPDGRQGAPFKRPSRPRGPPTQRTSNQPNPIPYSMLTLLKKNMQKMREVQWEKKQSKQIYDIVCTFSHHSCMKWISHLSIQKCLG